MDVENIVKNRIEECLYFYIIEKYLKDKNWVKKVI